MILNLMSARPARGQVRSTMSLTNGITHLLNSASASVSASFNSLIGLGNSPTTGGLHVCVDGALIACGGRMTSFLDSTLCTGLLVIPGGKAV